jgi:hypothetical protein
MATPDAVPGEPPEESARKQRQRSGNYSGRLLLRMPRSLHEELARASDRDGVSLNQFITSVLASSVEWRREDSGTGSQVRATSRRPRGMAIVLVLNLVLVGLAAAAAIGFLIAAWLS